ncbi:histidine ammonia-lyase [Anaerosphaera aminiphila DSM 21120]|uniref:Histidine ammonia-lyase n=1 Tax=Anaerosphaera aminiphila DSM 21120 TaxID=1120995 RepID=A0A1M5RM17_9FIRM|nr:aromatic amino acid ammonia-lyase [Anaerosphaera aminiphila]SHH27281.1 histidine ammonia-lyase [Anaerosphaera aminiphila DSM 21120]
MSIKLNKTLSIEEAMKVIRFKEKLEFTKEAKERVQASRDCINRAIELNIPMYGVTTGLGANSTKNISREETKLYQEKILKSHAVSVGREITEEEVRGIMLMVILNGIKGYSGVSLEALECYREALNKDIYIFVPGSGSVGYLSLEAHIALSLLGKGKIMYEGEWRNSSEVLEFYNIKPLDLSYKEALFLISGTTSVTAFATIGIYDMENLLKNFELLSAMEVEVNGATTRAFDERLMSVRKQSEQREAAKNILDYLKDSEICEKYYYENLQDPLSIRCIPQLIGPVKKRINEAKATILNEMDSCTDNPIIYQNGDEVEVISGCNPESSYIGLEMDCCAISLCMLAKMSERRTFRLLDEKLSGKPAFLVKDSGSNSGLMITQYTQAGLLNEMKVLATPSVIDNIPTCANQEDYVAMGFNSAKKIAKLVENLNYIMAIELLAIFQSNEFMDRDLKRSSVTEKIYKYLRDIVPILEEDIELYPIIEELFEVIKSGKLVEII